MWSLPYKSWIRYLTSFNTRVCYLRLFIRYYWIFRRTQFVLRENISRVTLDSPLRLTSTLILEVCMVFIRFVLVYESWLQVYVVVHKIRFTYRFFDYLLYLKSRVSPDGWTGLERRRKRRKSLLIKSYK